MWKKTLSRECVFCVVATTAGSCSHPAVMSSHIWPDFNTMWWKWLTTQPDTLNANTKHSITWVSWKRNRFNLLSLTFDASTAWNTLVVLHPLLTKTKYIIILEFTLNSCCLECCFNRISFALISTCTYEIYFLTRLTLDNVLRCLWGVCVRPRVFSRFHTPISDDSRRVAKSSSGMSVGLSNLVDRTSTWSEEQHTH